MIEKQKYKFITNVQRCLSSRYWSTIKNKKPIVIPRLPHLQQTQCCLQFFLIEFHFFLACYKFCIIKIVCFQSYVDGFMYFCLLMIAKIMAIPMTKKTIDSINSCLSNFIITIGIVIRFMRVTNIIIVLSIVASCLISA